MGGCAGGEHRAVFLGHPDPGSVAFHLDHRVCFVERHSQSEEDPGALPAGCA